jgi:ABC-type Fe3+ transport system permease subunit
MAEFIFYLLIHLIPEAWLINEKKEKKIRKKEVQQIRKQSTTLLGIFFIICSIVLIIYPYCTLKSAIDIAFFQY